MEIKLRYYNNELNYTTTITFYSDDFTNTNKSCIIRNIPHKIRRFVQELIGENSQIFIDNNNLYITKDNTNISVLIGGN